VSNKKQRPNVLVLDIETMAMKVWAWGLFDQNIGLNQIDTDWHLLSFSAKWLESEDKKIVYGPHRKLIYMDQSKESDITNDTKLLKALWELLDSADIVLGQNSKRFDVKKIFARFLLKGMKPPSPFRHLDTLILSKRSFALTSNKLEYLTGQLCTKNKKLTKRKFAGFDLWKECAAGNKDAWAEMKRYNPMDVLGTEEVFHHLSPWGTGVSLDVHNDSDVPSCNCGSEKLQRRGYNYSNTGKFQRFMCVACGAWYSGKTNLLSKEKRKASLK
jgi:hypothetical protein